MAAKKFNHKGTKRTKNSTKGVDCVFPFVLFFVCFVPSWLNFFLTASEKKKRLVVSQILWAYGARLGSGVIVVRGKNKNLKPQMNTDEHR